MSSSSEMTDSHKKRKRDIVPEDEDDKLEIDVNLPEPPSKKAKRKEKKQSKSKSSKTSKAESPTGDGDEKDDEVATKAIPTPVAAAPGPAPRSEYGIWIGNLPFSATRDSLKQFLLDHGGIDDDEITRIHLPTGAKGQNKGFAYIDFRTPSTLEIALTLSEKLTGGRKVLIKNAKSFEGRPKEKEATVVEKEPSKRIFVGNLSFDVTKADLMEHFSQAGKVDDVFMATFEDSGKSKGFAWVTFADIEAAKSAVQGWIYKKQEEPEEEEVVDGDEVETGPKRKPKKPMKWFINRMHSRQLRCEFAEDSQTRYKKRFGKNGPKPTDTAETPAIEETGAGAEDTLEGLAREAATARNSAPKKKDHSMKHLDKDQRQEMRRKKHDARMVAPGQALANAPRSSGAIVAGQGNKMTFD